MSVANQRAKIALRLTLPLRPEVTAQRPDDGGERAEVNARRVGIQDDIPDLQRLRSHGAILTWAVFAYLLTGFCGCTHSYQRHQQAARAEDTESRLEATATAEQQQRTTTTTAARGRRTTERFRPDGSLMERVIEQHEADGRIETETTAASKSTIARADFRSVRAASSSTAEGRTSWWPPWWLWLLAAGALTTVVWWLRWRARRLRTI